MTSHADRRAAMVDRQIAARGVTDTAVLAAMRRVPREKFIPADLDEFAYDDTPLPILEGQTISQPYIVALMAETLALSGGETVLEVGAGSGYAAAVLAEIAGEVVTIERHPTLAEMARANLAAARYTNVTVVEGDGTKGCPDRAPFDAIVVAAGGPAVPRSLREQLKIGGRLVIPIGPAQRLQTLKRITRTAEDSYAEEDLGAVAFVPLIGEQGWHPAGGNPTTTTATLPQAIAAAAEPFDDIETADLSGLMARIGDSRVVLIGEASHGTSEFYRMRARITRELIETKGFTIVGLEADWPDAALIDAWVRHRAGGQARPERREWTAFARFPTWMWRNTETRAFVDWLHDVNRARPEAARAGVHGLDMYSLYTSIGAVLDYLDEVDPEAARVARERYGCLTPYQHAPEAYGQMTMMRGMAACRDAVVAMLRDMMARRGEHALADGERQFDAEANARLVARAEEYYRILYRGGAASWNLRDSHMFETLERLLDFRGPDAKAVVWAHNSHVGDASATEMAARGEHNIGQLCRERWGGAVYGIGFGTHGGTVAAADTWDEPMEVMDVRPSQEDSYERLCHDSGVASFLLPLRHAPDDLRRRLEKPRLERAIGVIYRPRTERASHYFQAVLPEQFDEYVWFDRSHAVTPLRTVEMEGVADTYPFGL